MRIHGICVVKNESDIIEQGLLAAAKWCNHIYVLDNGSSDGTWDIVRDLAATNPTIVPWKQLDVKFSEGLRCHVYRRFSSKARAGDWWARIDPDEFYVDDPAAFLSSVPESDGYVWYAALTYYFSTEEARRFEANPSQFDDQVPIAEKCRHYFNHWSEVRFVRHEHMEPWKGEGACPWPGWPERLLYTARSHDRRILCRHFCYRSPSQIECRLRTRAPNSIEGGVWWHEAVKNWGETFDPLAIRKNRTKRRWNNLKFQQHAGEMTFDWRSRVVDASNLHYDSHDGNFVLNEDLMPALPRFNPKYYEMRDRIKQVFGKKYNAC